ncbi:MAG: hypothetical protein M1828_000204 [Chrysothrix sp. TS-e1954]|nr:MAG: hypothetical protein M1828_000204 [Chrysothrix sp. TS-e1954]
MPPPRLVTTSQALYRVFISPQIPLPAHSPRTRASILHTHHIRPTTQRRCIYRGTAGRAPPTKEVSVFTDPNHPLDEAIRKPFVHIVTPQGLDRKVFLQDVLANLDRTKEHARQVATDELDTPIVKITSITALYEESRKLRPKKQAEEKQMELNWAIDHKGDLIHRLKKLGEWLGEGKNVEVLLAPKKHGRRATPEECQHVLDRIQETVDGVKGAKESKAMDGALGRRSMLHFKGDEKKIEGEEEVKKVRSRDMSREERMAIKEREKKEWKAELEARARRKDERKAQQRDET